METAGSRRTYDHRIREAILESGDREHFPELEIPDSTIRSWIHRGLPKVVTSEQHTCDRTALVSEIRALRHRAALLAGVVGLLVVMLRISKDRADCERYAGGRSKATLVGAIDRASEVLPLTVAQRVADLSYSRFHSWRQLELRCESDWQAQLSASEA